MRHVFHRRKPDSCGSLMELAGSGSLIALEMLGLSSSEGLKVLPDLSNFFS